jgi:hypothetical protein
MHDGIKINTTSTLECLNRFFNDVSGNFVDENDLITIRVCDEEEFYESHPKDRVKVSFGVVKIFLGVCFLVMLYFSKIFKIF